jgi:hypothetical protein
MFRGDSSPRVERSVEIVLQLKEGRQLLAAVSPVSTPITKIDVSLRFKCLLVIAAPQQPVAR